jgi:transposase
MDDINTQIKFVQLRAQGWSFARISEQIKVSKPTLINWSRKFRFDIQNLRAIEFESLRDTLLTSVEARTRKLGEQLQIIESELAKRNLSELSTGQLFALAAALRRQIQRETGDMQFTSPLKEIPNDEYHEQVQDWKP